LLEQ
jgi:hypothetical protein